ncbi:MAG: cysteine--tRNA ligase, partial [Pseudomonadota bacterium]
VPEKGQVLDGVIAALGHDLDFSRVRAYLDAQFSLSRRARPDRKADNSKTDLRNNLAATLVWLGLAAEWEFDVARANVEGIGKSVEAALVGLKASDIQTSILNRLAFIAEKNWAEADRIRDELLVQGIQLKDSKDPETGERVTTWEVVR